MEKPKLSCILLTGLNLNNWYTHTSGTVADLRGRGGPGVLKLIIFVLNLLIYFVIS